MTYDAKTPTTLKNRQQWFASIITEPLIEGSSINPVTPEGRTIAEEANQWIAPSPTLEPWQRMEIYNQQYWWRLLKILQNIYPTLTRLFGYEDFNKTIAVPYLVKYPSKHWSIDHIGNCLTNWIEEDYKDEDQGLIYDVALVDHTIDRTFVIPNRKAIDMTQLPQGTNISDLLSRKIYLQPWVTLFELKYDLFRFREHMLKEEVEHWMENDFPSLMQEREKYYFVVWRDAEKNVVWDELSEAEYLVLNRFQEGNTIERACEWLEKQGKGLCDQAAAHIHFWFQEWTLKHWLTLDKQSN